MRKLISLVCVVMLSGASGFAVANDMDKHDASNSDMTTSGSSNATRDSSSTDTRTTPPNSSNR